VFGPYVRSVSVNSLYEWVKEKIMEARMPGMMSGRTTWKNRLTVLAPHTLAASRTRSSSPSKVAERTRIAYGAHTDTCASATPR
jgi:hypothetical protein